MPTDRAPANRDRDRHRREAAAALLLLGRSRRYSLPDLIRQHGIKPKPFRAIQPTQALKVDMAAPHRAIVNAWAAQADEIVTAHRRSPEASRAALSFATAAIGGYLTTAKRQIEPAATRIEQWHRLQWAGRIKAATGLDVSFLTAQSDVSADVAKTVAWNEALANDVSRQVQHRIATALLSGGDAAPAIREAIAKGKRRAVGIGDDQAIKLSRAMDRSRREAAGVTTYRWVHSHATRHPRDWHLARDGFVFETDDIPDGDRASQPPFCGCLELPVLA